MESFQQTPNLLLIHSESKGLYVFALVILTIAGLVFLVIPRIKSYRVGAESRLKATGFGLLFVFMGAWHLLTNEAIDVKVDSNVGIIVIQRVSWVSKADLQIPFKDVEKVFLMVREARDEDDKPTFKPCLRLKSGETIPLFSGFRVDRTMSEAIDSELSSRIAVWSSGAVEAPSGG